MRICQIGFTDNRQHTHYSFFLTQTEFIIKCTVINIQNLNIKFIVMSTIITDNEIKKHH